MADATGISYRRYRVLGVIGTGGFGTVYRARLEGPNGFTRDVAIKLLKDAFPPPEVLLRLRDEARIMGLVRDRAVVSVDPPMELGGRWAVVMDYVEGASLQALLRQGPLPEAVALEIVAEIARSLDHLWSALGPDDEPLRLLHRDLKPSNIQLTRTGEVKLLDFGIAKAAFEEREAQTTHAISGTAGYMAPERMVGEEGETTDVFSLGVLLLELVIGKRPSLDQILHEPLGIDRYLVELARSMCKMSPSERPTPAQVEVRAKRLSARWTVTLGEWARSSVPATIVRPDDPLVGQVLTERRLIETTGSSFGPAGAFVGIGGASVGLISVFVSLLGIVGVLGGALWWQLTLQARERSRLDERTLEQARLIASTDPARALSLLEELSPSHPFDGAVHAIVATATTAQPGRRLPLPHGFVPERVAVGPAGLVSAAGSRVLVFGPALERGIERAGGSDVVDVAVTSQHRAWCTPETLVLEERPTPLALEAPCRSLLVTDDTLYVRTSAALLRLEGNALVPLGALDDVDHAQTRGAHLWTWETGQATVHDLREGLPQVARTELTIDSIYGAWAEPNRLALAGQEPALTLLELVGGRLTVEAPAIDASWLATTTRFGNGGRYLAAGGDAESVRVIDDETGTSRDVGLRGRPYDLVPSGDGLLVATDRGQVAFVEPAGGRFSLRELGSSDEPLIRLHTQLDGAVVAQGRTSLHVLKAEIEDGVVVYRSKEGGVGLTAGSDGLYAASDHGLARIRGTEVEALSDRATLRSMRCRNNLWIAHPDGLERHGGDTVPVESRPTRMACAPDGSFAVATLTDGTLLVFDPISGTVHGNKPIEGLERSAMVDILPAPDGLYLIGASTWRLTSATGEPTIVASPVHGSGSAYQLNGELLHGSRLGVVQRANGTTIGTLTGSVVAMSSVDGQLFAGGYFGGLLRWTSLDRPPERVEGHSQYVHRLAPHPQGRWMASSGWDNRVWVWDTSTHPLVGRPLPEHPAPVVGLAWSRDGRALYTSDLEGTVRMWKQEVPAEPRALRAFVEALVARLR